MSCLWSGFPDESSPSPGMCPLVPRADLILRKDGSGSITTEIKETVVDEDLRRAFSVSGVGMWNVAHQL